MVKLTTNEILKLGSSISDTLIELRAIKNNELKIVVDDESFLKIDEDLFYRNPNNVNESFIPSEEEINITFPNVVIKIVKNTVV